MRTDGSEIDLPPHKGNGREDLEDDVAITPPSWLSEMSEGELTWAVDYLYGRTSHWQKLDINLGPRADVNALARTVRNLESTARGVKLVVSLRNALRQRRYRLSDGGRETCSFTLPGADKAALARLAKGNGITVTAQIQRLIEDATRLTEEQKEGKRREALTAKVMRNKNKLALELHQIRIEKTRKQLHQCMKQLARWETFLKEELPELSPEDEATAAAIAEKRLRAIQEAIDAAAAKHEMMSPRSV